MIRLKHFLDASGYRSTNRTADCRRTVPGHLPGTVGLLPVSSRTAGLYNPRGHCGHAEVTDDTYNHEDTIYAVRCVRYECRVLHLLDVLLQHQDLYAREDSPEQVTHR